MRRSAAAFAVDSLKWRIRLVFFLLAFADAISSSRRA
jgi:hypothetical protein